jgi:hypothetical protein
MTCCHPKSRHVRMSENVASQKLPILTQWCGLCGALKTGDGPWRIPDLQKKRASK